MLQSWLRDLSAFACGAGKIVNVDMGGDIEQSASHWDIEGLVRCLQLVTEALNTLQTQANKHRALEAMALGILKEIRKYRYE